MSGAMTYKLPPLPETGYMMGGKGYSGSQMQAYAIAAIEAQGVPDGYAGAAAFTNVMPTVAIHFSANEQALSFLDKIRASWDRQQRSIASTHPAQQAKPQPDPLHDDIQSVLFEVEQAIQNGCCPWQVEAEFEAYEAARRLQQPAHGITKE